MHATISRAGRDIETVLGKNLVALTPGLTKFSDDAVKLIDAFIDSGAMTTALQGIRSGLRWVEDSLGSSEFKHAAKLFLSGLETLGPYIDRFVNGPLTKGLLLAGRGLYYGADLFGNPKRDVGDSFGEMQCALIMEPFGQDSAVLRFEEFAPNADIYGRVANELSIDFQRMNPPPVSKNEAVARAIFMVRNLGFFSAHCSPGEAAVMLGLTLRELCGRPIAGDVMEFLAGHLLSARQAALRRGFAGAAETLQ
jgi:hypothetical protein